MLRSLRSSLATAIGLCRPIAECKPFTLSSLRRSTPNAFHHIRALHRPSSIHSATPSPSPPPPPETRIQASLQLYERHLFVTSATPALKWPKRLEGEHTGVAERIYNHLSDAMRDKQFTSNNPLGDTIPSTVTICPRISVCDLNNLPTDEFQPGDLIAISANEPPTHLRDGRAPIDMRTGKPIHLNDAIEVKRLSKIMGFDMESVKDHAPTNTPDVDADYDILVFVCSHGERDARCGSRGPPLIQWLNEFGSQVASSAVGHKFRLRAVGCSHIGGHEFAGNIIMYAWKRGSSISSSSSSSSATSLGGPLAVNDWFGLLDPTRLPSVIHPYAQFVVNAFQHGSTLDAIRAARLKLLNQPLTVASSSTSSLSSPSSSSSSPSSSSICSTCEPLLTPNVTKLGQIWRGSMGVEKAEARALIQQVAHKD